MLGAGAILLAALLGSIPFGLLLTRAAGLGDVRSIGSGNIGATNVLRTGNKKLAAATLLLDALKGAAAVWLAGWIAGPGWEPAAAVAAVLGHCHPPWLGFQGGKGMATALGVMLGLAWPIFLIAALTWLVAARLSRRSSVGAMAAIAVAPAAALVFATPGAALGLLILGVHVIWRHKENIQRLLAGTEPRIGEGR
ncbi:glycerol-3-phosphate 1-O-acyltransferase [Roseococcus sp. SYP-B2431]|uniref:glycerol-3-phosphate 1-O-acyltransferase PlsY n=1 Tax=Roseococcus sp. SYP-B2431 TaxID=2496640 RepID=UPI00103FD68C|nr:glycerol-3-phosphate 1-O-acyltransferase PlsY [Roseococcus sp. SYP-B2431]TCH99405.1 glycerol-3-phosphate 1-O-acyltransferase [Roseococcus sp. SYP-B2431]